MTMIPLRQLTASLDTTTGDLILETQEGALPEHPDPAMFTPRMNIRIEVNLGNVTYRDISTGEFVDPEQIMSEQLPQG